ncbi:hypothetical protein FZC78_08170 [Rossellomorea vietnamensis]|uniref:Phenylalanyl-tRNA synthetase subunit beta n=1 Tax=Rossellomorea vietnamensis TaxID=218284 RepID=A0A5D4NWW5_9BACI|nr:hypothetical protein [Rossellomorea vietnamensis]TYS17816.1 hypothetical protein FZC78_08170 [Rossellomorea vietnamensis]
MKLLKILAIAVVVLGIAGFAVYHFGTNMAMDKIGDFVDQESANPGQVEEVKRQIAANPELQQFLNDGVENVDESTLVYQTKEEAINGVIKKVGISELMNLQSKVSDGVTPEEQSEIIALLEEKMSEEEILALKVLANKELGL